MSDSVNVKSSPSVKRAVGVADYVANARAAYGEALPDWVLILAQEANRTTGVAVGKRIGYSGSVVTSVCKAVYAGDLSTVEARVRGALMGAVVVCPIMGEIGRDHCLDEQKKRFCGTSQLRTALYGACPKCHHYRGKGGANA